MPIFRFPYDQKEGNRLERPGPLIPVVVSVPEALENFWASSGRHVPAPIRGMALIDTGAYASAIDTAVFLALQIQAIDRAPFASAGGNATSEIFPANLSFPELKISKLEMERVLGCPLGWTGKNDEDFLMLIGRDILKNFLLVYDGVHGELLIGH